MLHPVQKKMAIAFWIVALIDLTGIALQQDSLHLVAKPILMPVLLLLILKTKSITANKNLLLSGLFFSWMGDVFLLFENKNQLFFIVGLASFLITHIFYIIYFLRIRSYKLSLIQQKPVLIAVVLSYGISLVWQLYPHLHDLRLPVIIYATTICTMLLCSLHIFLKVNKQSAFYFLLGAAFFVISDSILAINKFYQPVYLAGLLIMLTYCLAQFFIVLGFTQQKTA